MTFKLGIVIGHTAAKGGAKGINLSVEYHYNSEVAKDMENYAAGTYGSSSTHPLETKLFFRDLVGVPGAYRAADEWRANATVELHYNAATPTARGTETLSSGSAASLKFAKLVQGELCSLLNRNGDSRGVKIRNRQKQDRGWLSLVSGAAPAIITEPAFGSNAADAALLRAKKFEIGRKIVDQAHAFFYS